MKSRCDEIQIEDLEDTPHPPQAVPLPLEGKLKRGGNNVGTDLPGGQPHPAPYGEGEGCLSPMKGESFMKIGILGGSFSPIHKGHLHAALRAKESLKLDEIILIPAGRPPHKVLPEGTPSDADRLAMTGIGAETIGAKVLDIEILREGKSYTAETLSYLKEKHPEDEFFFIMGTDMILTVDTWYKPEVIFSLATLCAVARGDGDIRMIEEKAKELEKLGAKIEIIRCEAFPASSTEIRADIKGKRHLLPEGVYDYILRENLYGIPGENN